MKFFLTLVASDEPLTAGHLAVIERHLDFEANGMDGDPLWLSPHKAADIPLMGRPNKADLTELREALATNKIDLFITPEANRRKKLLLADMDSTIVTGETLDDLAEHAGIKNAVAAITERAMQGKLDFHEALRERIALLTDLPTSAIEETLAKTKLNAGAETFVKTMKKHGATCVLVSGGFTHFTAAIAKQCGFDHHHGNTLDIANDKLTGELILPILDKSAKLDYLKKYTQNLGLNTSDTLTIGDGANDLPMLEAASLGLGYHAKPIVSNAIDNTIHYGDLTAALYAQGFKDEEFAA